MVFFLELYVNYFFVQFLFDFFIRMNKNTLFDGDFGYNNIYKRREYSMSLNIGAHLSIAAGYEQAVKAAVQIGSNTFQFFTRNPRGGAARAFNPPDVKIMSELMLQYHFAPIVAHSPYTINMASDNPTTRLGAKELLKADLELLDKLPCKLYNVHPGNNKSDAHTGIERICEAINEVLSPQHQTYLLLETMSGKGGEMGKTFEEIRAMIDGIELDEKIGVCIDACHVYCAGYDIVRDLDGVMNRFDKIIGLDRLMAVHLNDSMNPFDSHKDHHAKIGEGSIGLEALIRMINHPALKKLPFILETPNELDGFKKEIELFKENFVE